jgi:hypothetical protein
MTLDADDGLPEPDAPPSATNADSTEQDPLVTQVKMQVKSDAGMPEVQGDVPSAESKAVEAKGYNV